MNPPNALQQCEQMRFRAFFDYTVGECKPFYGCESPVVDANNFRSAEECNFHCAALAPFVKEHQQIPRELPPMFNYPMVATSNIQHNDQVRPSPVTPIRELTQLPLAQQPLLNIEHCYQNPSALEKCDSVGPRFYFDPATRNCYPFYGCSLGALAGNNFNSLEHCERTCNVVSHSAQPIASRSIPQPPPPPPPRPQPPPAPAPLSDLLAVYVVETPGQDIGPNHQITGFSPVTNQQVDSNWQQRLAVAPQIPRQQQFVGQEEHQLPQPLSPLNGYK